MSIYGSKGSEEDKIVDPRQDMIDGLKEAGKALLWIGVIAIVGAATYGLGLILIGIAYATSRKSEFGKRIFPDFGKIRDGSKAAWRRLFSRKKRSKVRAAQEEQEVGQDSREERESSVRSSRSSSSSFYEASLPTSSPSSAPVSESSSSSAPDDISQQLLNAVQQNNEAAVVEQLIKKFKSNGGTLDEIRADNSGFNLLDFAIMNKNIEIISLLVQEGANVNAQGEDGFTPLHTAASAGNLEAIEILVKNGANPNIQDVHGNTPLHYAMSMLARHPNDNTYKEVAIFLIQYGANGEIQNEEGQTPQALFKKSGGIPEAFPKILPLHEAVSQRNMNLVQSLVESGADLNIQDRRDQTPLHLAVNNKDIDMVKYLVEKGAKLDIEDYTGMTPSRLAHNKDFYAIHKFLEHPQSSSEIQKSSDILAARSVSSVASSSLSSSSASMSESSSSSTPASSLISSVTSAAPDSLQYEILLSAVRSGEVSTLQSSLQGDKEVVNTEDEQKKLINALAQGRTLLHHAVVAGHLNVVQFLCERGADVSIKDKGGYTPLKLAQLYDFDTISKYLIAHGAIDEAADKAAESIASRSSKKSLLSKLRDGTLSEKPPSRPAAPLSLSELDKDYLPTEFFEAIEGGNKTDVLQAYVDEFKKHHPSLDEVENADGDGLLYMAIRANNIDAVKLLLKEGANPNIKNKKRETPLDLARDMKNSSIIELLEPLEVKKSSSTPDYMDMDIFDYEQAEEKEEEKKEVAIEEAETEKKQEVPSRFASSSSQQEKRPEVVAPTFNLSAKDPEKGRSKKDPKSARSMVSRLGFSRKDKE